MERAATYPTYDDHPFPPLPGATHGSSDAQPSLEPSHYCTAPIAPSYVRILVYSYPPVSSPTVHAINVSVAVAASIIYYHHNVGAICLSFLAEPFQPLYDVIPLRSVVDSQTQMDVIISLSWSHFPTPTATWTLLAVICCCSQRALR